jgi:hypothetical protein
MIPRSAIGNLKDRFRVYSGQDWLISAMLLEISANILSFWRRSMRKVATLAAVGVLALGAVTASNAEARGGRNAGAAVAAGIVGVAAGALIAGAASPAYAYPAYGPVVSYGHDGYYAGPVYRHPPRVKRVVRYYEEPVPVYRPRRVVRTYEYAPVRTRTVTYSYGAPYYGDRHYGW